MVQVRDAGNFERIKEAQEICYYQIFPLDMAMQILFKLLNSALCLVYLLKYTK